MKACPQNSTNFREVQCTSYNKVQFRGRYYKWKPYTGGRCKSQLIVVRLKIQYPLRHGVTNHIEGYIIQVALHQIKWLPGQSSRRTVKCLRSECNEGCDWCIYVTVVTCADTLTSTYVFSSFCCLMNYYTVTFATCWYMGWVKILQVTFCVNLTVATVNFL